MPHKISGIKNGDARVILIDESDWNTIESNTIVVGSGEYEILDVVSGTKTVLVRGTDGEAYGFGGIATVFYEDPIPEGGDRGIFAGGQTSGVVSRIQYITLSNIGNSTNFGNLTLSRRGVGANSNAGFQRGTFAGGLNSSSNPVSNIDYITINTNSNATAFGNLTESRAESVGFSNGYNDRGIHGTGQAASGSSVIDYITISTTSNSTNFGDSTQAIRARAGNSNASNERGCFNGGWATSNIIDYITINTTGNASSFGNLAVGRRYLSGTSNGTNERGVQGGGYTTTYTGYIDYYTINTGGNASNFGATNGNRYGVTANSNGTSERGTFGGGRTTSNVNNINYITINTTGAIADFGDMVEAIFSCGGTSNA